MNVPEIGSTTDRIRRCRLDEYECVHVYVHVYVHVRKDEEFPNMMDCQLS